MRQAKAEPGKLYRCEAVKAHAGAMDLDDVDAENWLCNRYATVYAKHPQLPREYLLCNRCKNQPQFSKFSLRPILDDGGTVK